MTVRQATVGLAHEAPCGSVSANLANPRSGQIAESMGRLQGAAGWGGLATFMCLQPPVDGIWRSPRYSVCQMYAHMYFVTRSLVPVTKEGWMF